MFHFDVGGDRPWQRAEMVGPRALDPDARGSLKVLAASLAIRPRKRWQGLGCCLIDVVWSAYAVDDVAVQDVVRAASGTDGALLGRGVPVRDSWPARAFVTRCSAYDTDTLPQLVSPTSFADESFDAGLAKWAEAAHAALALHEHGIERVMDIVKLFEDRAERRLRHLDETLADLPGAFAGHEARSQFWRLTCEDYDVVDAAALLEPLRQSFPALEPSDVAGVVEALTEMLGQETTSAWQVGEALRRHAGLPTVER